MHSLRHVNMRSTAPSEVRCGTWAAAEMAVDRACARSARSEELRDDLGAVIKTLPRRASPLFVCLWCSTALVSQSSCR